MGHAARIIKLIVTDDLRGRGTPESPYYRVTQYFTLRGVLLWESLPPGVEMPESNHPILGHRLTPPGGGVAP